MAPRLGKPIAKYSLKFLNHTLNVIIYAIFEKYWNNTFRVIFMRSLLSNRAISITAPRRWNDLPPELRTISSPPPPSLQITRHHLPPPPLSATPGLPLKIKMSSLQTLLSWPIWSFNFSTWRTPTLIATLSPPGILEIGSELLLTPPLENPLWFVAALVNKLVP